MKSSARLVVIAAVFFFVVLVIPKWFAIRGRHKKKKNAVLIKIGKRKEVVLP